MAINRVSPGIEIREFDRSIVAQQPNRPIGAIAGIFNKGPVGTPVLVRNEEELASTFGRPTGDNDETFFTAASYLAYSDQLYVVRVANNALNSFAKPKVEIGSVAIYSQSGVFTNSDIITVTGANTITTANLSIVTDSDGKITSIALGNSGVFNSSDFPLGTNGLVNVVANNETTGSTNLNLSVTYRPTATGTQSNITINTSIKKAANGQAYYDDIDWRQKIGYTGYTTDTDVLFVSRSPSDDYNNYRISMVDSTAAYQSSLFSALNAASANVIFVKGSSTVNVVTANANAASTLATKIGYRDILAYNLLKNIDGSKAEVPIQNMIIIGKTIVGSNVVLSLDRKITTETTTSIVSNGTFLITAGGNANTTQKANIGRRWEFSGQGPFSPISVDGASNKALLPTNVIDKVYTAIVNDKNQLVSAIVGSRVRSAQPGFVNQYYVDKINQDSTNKFVWWANHIPGMTTGTNPAILTNSTMVVPFNAFIGRGSDVVTEDSVTLSALMDGYDKFKDKSTINVDVLITGKSTGGINGEGLVNYLVDNICEQRRDCIVFASPQKDDLVSDSNTANYDKMIAYSNSVLNSSFCVIDSGYKVMYDRYNNKNIDVPLNGDVAGLYVRTVNRLGPWWSPAGFNRGELRNTIRLYYNPSEIDRDQLYPASINPVVQFPGQDPILFGDKTTLNQGSAFDHINVRGLFIYLQKIISNVSKFTLFEFNDEFTRARFIGQVDPILRDVKGRRGIYDYRLICDETNNTPEIIDANGFVADIYIKPARSINFIQLNFVAMSTGMQFNEIIGQYEI